METTTYATIATLKRESHDLFERYFNSNEPTRDYYDTPNQLFTAMRSYIDVEREDSNNTMRNLIRALACDFISRIDARYIGIDTDLSVLSIKKPSDFNISIAGLRILGDAAWTLQISSRELWCMRFYNDETGEVYTIEDNLFDRASHVRGFIHEMKQWICDTYSCDVTELNALKSENRGLRTIIDDDTNTLNEMAKENRHLRNKLDVIIDENVELKNNMNALAGAVKDIIDAGNPDLAAALIAAMGLDPFINIMANVNKHDDVNVEYSIDSESDDVITPEEMMADIIANIED